MKKPDFQPCRRILSAGRPTRKFEHLITPVPKARRLCLITINSAWYQSSLALRYLRNCLKGLPLRVKLLEFTTSEPLFEILARIACHKADIYCFSAYVWNRNMLQALLPELAKLQPLSRIVLGGPDADGERLVQDALDLLMENRTSIIIAHRLSTVRRCDQILVMSGGARSSMGSAEAPELLPQHREHPCSAAPAR